ncbi:MAG TPA: UDP-4-amino-4,6-dideoxy-N-acetyl-beta-L-altrosamine transaminase [Candidatus Binatia bacterium]|nr:UDP-4-amino-4,6-dideoxy-N-acetyl-beta-L-altrosamine transaminase [Candidatus Binatia bacterium]
MPLLPYSRQTVGEEEAAAVAAAVRAALLTGGPTLARFEAALAEATGARHAIAVSSGTAALHTAYRAAGLGPGDAILTSPLTFVATASAAAHAGAVVRFADVGADGCLDPAAVARAVADGPAPKLLVPVHYAGHPADLEALAAAAPGATIVEDACHALGAEYRDRAGAWHAVGSCAHAAMAVMSFHPVKAITTGEGGAVLTNDRGLAERCRRIRDHGLVREPPGADGPWAYELHEPGFNYRLTDVQAALGLVQLGRLSDFIARRRRIAALYDRTLAAVPAVEPVMPRRGTRSAHHLYVVRVPAGVRRAVFEMLRARGIGVQVHYVPVHRQPYYRRLLGDVALPAAERLYGEILSLPCFPGLTGDDVAEVVAALGEALAEATREEGHAHPVC